MKNIPHELCNYAVYYYDNWVSQVIQLDESLLSDVTVPPRTIEFNLKESTRGGWDFIRLYRSILTNNPF